MKTFWNSKLRNHLEKGVSFSHKRPNNKILSFPSHKVCGNKRVLRCSRKAATVTAMPQKRPEMLRKRKCGCITITFYLQKRAPWSCSLPTLDLEESEK